MENIFKLYLNSRLWQIDLESDLLSHEDIGISRLLEQRLQHIELLPSEGCPLSPLLLSAVWQEMKNKYLEIKTRRFLTWSAVVHGGRVHRVE